MANTMHAVAYRASLPVDSPDSLIDVELPVPEPGPHDLLVRVNAVSVNPVDVKVRARNDPAGATKVLGYDAAGVIEAVGADVTLFAPGDAVYYAGSIDRPGTNADFHLVDERLVGHLPETLDFAHAAALPLTAITAWEALFDRFALSRQATGRLLILGAAGGVGSILVQLARTLTDLTVIGTASRPDSQGWVSGLGAHHVVDHHGDLTANAHAVAPEGVDYIFTPHSRGNVDAFAALLRPGGHITAIDEPEGLDLRLLKTKSLSWHWEYMFTRPLFAPDDQAHHELLDDLARLIDKGTIRSTLTTQLQPMNAGTLREAHRLVETGRTIGKIVVSNT
jgi:zinc-binding alcohol dehydrogenase family protein